MRTKSLDTPTIDDIIDDIPGDWGSYFEARQNLKQALLQWHKDKARSYVPEKLDQDNSMTNDIYNTGHNACVDQTLKSIGESK